MEDAKGGGGKKAAAATRVASLAQATLKIGQSGDGSDSGSDVQTRVACDRGMFLRICVGVGHEGVGKPEAGEHVTRRPGGGEGSTAAKGDSVGGAPRRLSGREGLGKGVERANLLGVEGLLTRRLSAGKSGLEAGTTAVKGGQESGSGDAEAGGQ